MPDGETHVGHRRHQCLVLVHGEPTSGGELVEAEEREQRAAHDDAPVQQHSIAVRGQRRCRSPDTRGEAQRTGDAPAGIVGELVGADEASIEVLGQFVTHLTEFFWLGHRRQRYRRTDTGLLRTSRQREIDWSRLGPGS